MSTSRPPHLDGIDVLRIANRSIRGWSPWWKGPRRMPFTSIQEDRAILAMLFDPRILYAQRADVSPAFVATNRLAYRLSTPYVVEYAHDDGLPGRPHDYYLDFRGLLDGGVEFVLEAGRAADKARGRDRAKAAAARRDMAARRGRYYLVTGESLSETRFANYAILRSRHHPFEGSDEIERAADAHWLGETELTPAEVIERLSGAFGAARAEAGVWRRLARAAVAGHLVLDLDAVLLTQDTPVLLLPPHAPAILPPELPSELPPIASSADQPEPPPAPEPAVELAVLPERKRAIAVRNERIIAMAADGVTPPVIADATGISRRQVERVLRDAAAGRLPAVPYPKHPFVSEADPAYTAAIAALLATKRKRTVEELRTAPELKAVWEHLRAGRSESAIPEAEQRRIKRPSWDQVSRIRRHLLRADPGLAHAQSGRRHPARLSTSVRKYMLGIAAPGLVTQVDEHTFDVLLLLDGQQITTRVHCAVLVCVKTGAILAGVLSPAPFAEEDYMRLLKQALEPKDALVEQFGCEHDWPVIARAGEILSDRGLIFTSTRATSVLVDNLGITQKQAPPWAPSCKGTVEAVFRFMTKKFAHRFDATTLGSIAARGAHDPDAAARRNGMTYAEFEGYFYRAIVDGYMRDWDEVRDGPRWQLWGDAVALHGLPRWVGSADDLKLLLMKAENPRRPDGLYPSHEGGISFRGHWYVGHDGLTARLHETDEGVAVLWDKRDLVTIYLQSASGAYLGAATTSELGPGPVSEWEMEARRRARKAPRDAARAESDDSMTALQAEARTLPTGRARRAAAAKVARDQRTAAALHDLHLEGVVAERDEIVRRAQEEAAGVIPFPKPLPVVREPGAPRRRALVEFYDDDDRRGVRR